MIMDKGVVQNPFKFIQIGQFKFDQIQRSIKCQLRSFTY